MFPNRWEVLYIMKLFQRAADQGTNILSWRKGCKSSVKHWDSQNNEKTMEHSDHWITTEMHGESGIFKTMKRQWNILITGSWLDGMENSEIFKTMKRQWNILITGSWLDDMENSGIFKTMKRQWNILIIGSWLNSITDDRLYQMNHCVSIPVIFMISITPDDACDTYCQNGAYCQNAWLLTFHGVDYTYCQKWRPSRAHKKSRTQFWLSDSSCIIYNLWWHGEQWDFQNNEKT